MEPAYVFSRSNIFAYLGYACLIIAWILLVWAMQGCSILPTGAQTYWAHTSHPFAGPPFGPTDEEDSLDTFNGDLFWENESWFFELGMGYKLADGGFYGPKLTGNVRTGYRFRFKNAWKTGRDAFATCGSDSDCAKLESTAYLAAEADRKTASRAEFIKRHEYPAL
jgi:hypothetical protein